jgi:diguanylate cyclase (GGDEF)-like protein
MSRQVKPLGEPQQSVGKYIRSIGRHYFNTLVVMMLLIGATYMTVLLALERHSLQQNISFLTSNQFIRFQQLANQTRAIMRASADTTLPEYTIGPMRDDIIKAIEDIRVAGRQLDVTQAEINKNFLERLIPRDDETERLRRNLMARLGDFLERAERIADAGTKERRERYSFWGAVDFAVSSDSILMRQFGDLIRRSHERSTVSIHNAKLIATSLLSLIAVSVVLTGLFLFSPLLRKLSNEHRRTVDYEGRMAQLAHTDALTGLGNRSLFNQTMIQLFGKLEQSGEGFSLLLVDLDRFKGINDSYGHPAGDAVLRHVACALQDTIRASDIVARLGGDEFAVLLPGLSDESVLAGIAARAMQAIAAGVSFDGRILQTSVSIGGAVAPCHANDEASLLRVADLALYAAKSRRNTAVIFDEAALKRRVEENQLSLALVQAADRGEFVVHYQPKIDLATGLQIGSEALVRWQHPKLGLLPPGRFLPLMEGTQLIRSMTRAVVEAVGRDLRDWKNAGLVPGVIAINLPEVLLAGEEGYNLLAEAICKNHLDWRDFAVEITEDVFLNRNAEQILKGVTRFREQGVSVSLDDFGTGFASLVHLRDFPIDELKIDRSFISGIETDPRSVQIIRAIIDLSRNLGKRCVAEGIETDGQRRFLLEAGCDVGQGYLFAKPEPADQAGSRLPHAIRQHEAKGRGFSARLRMIPAKA